MPILHFRHQESPPCACCGEGTRSTTGTVDIGLDPASIYLARWNPRAPGHGIALLIGLGDSRGFVAAKCEVERHTTTIIGPEDYDWQSGSIQIMDCSEVIDTPLASRVFRVIEEIWIHDPEIKSFAEKTQPSRDDNEMKKPNNG